MVRRWLAVSEIPDEQAKDIGLENWHDDISKEEFSLEAIATFGKLSTLDEPQSKRTICHHGQNRSD
ncbi:hypothetical protein [Coleofasciculus sp. E1-EBD-02]|uniref:hypothetical protein n=1 Tax=Coleofasciculus sp. E1-EBD-02 TaxID=3068481 RepID=UPI0032F35305